MNESSIAYLDRFLSGMNAFEVFALAALIAAVLAAIVNLSGYLYLCAASRMRREEPAERTRLSAAVNVVPFVRSAQ